MDETLENSKGKQLPSPEELQKRYKAGQPIINEVDEEDNETTGRNTLEAKDGGKGDSSQNDIATDAKVERALVIDDPVTKLRKKVFKINLIGVVVGALSSMIVLYCFVRSYRSFDKQFFPFEAMRLNWAREVIYDIKGMENGICPLNYTTMMSYIYPGTFEGCDCRGSSKYPKTYVKGTCTADQLTNGCSMSVPLPETEIHKWKDTDRLCIQRLAGVSMNTMVTKSDASSTSRCQSGYKLCPVDKRDPDNPITDSSRMMCVPDWMIRCPVTNISISDCRVVPMLGSGCFEDKPDMKIVLNQNNLCLWKSFVCGRGPISKFMISEDTPCRVDDIDTQIAVNHNEFFLNKKNRTRCLPNENARLLDYATQDYMFRFHNINIDAVKDFGINIKNFTFGLYAIDYVKFEWEHRTDTDLNLIFNNEAQITKLEKYHGTAIIFFAIAVVVFVVISPILFHVETQNPRMYKHNQVGLFCKYLLLWFFKLSTVPVIALIMMYNSDIYLRFKAYSTSKFSNDYENQKVESMASSLESGIYVFDRFALWVAVIAIFIDIVIMYFTCTTEETKMKNEELELDESLADGVELK